MTNRLTKSGSLTEHEAMNLSLTNLYMRLKAYEDTELDPEEVERCAKAVKEGPLVVLPCGDDVTPIKCTGLKCPMQAGKVDPDTCKAVEACKWATKPLTNADRIRAMKDEELAHFIAKQRLPTENQIEDKLGIGVTVPFIVGQKIALNWLKQEVEDGY